MRLECGLASTNRNKLKGIKGHGFGFWLGTALGKGTRNLGDLRDPPAFLVLIGKNRKVEADHVFDDTAGWLVMCYLVYFSTTSEADFSEVRSEHFHVLAPDLESDAEGVGLLAYPHRWYLSSRFGGCSCHYRHVCAERGFGPIEDWSPEELDDVEATYGVYDFLLGLVGEGHQVDVVDLWDGDPSEEVVNIEVNLSEVPREHFRFLFGARLVLT